MKWSEVERRVMRAIKAFRVSGDLYLIEKDANERSISHRLAVHLDKCFRNWHVDCEYNRSGDLPKTLVRRVREKANPDDVHATTVFPDIVVHRRGKKRNLLVLEMKKIKCG